MGDKALTRREQAAVRAKQGGRPLKGHVWIIEFKRDGVWWPQFRVGYIHRTRAEGRLQAASFNENSWGVPYRVAKYVKGGK